MFAPGWAILVLVASLALLTLSARVESSAVLGLRAGQVEDGQAIFAENCARCHGDAGEGLEGPTLIGPGNALSSYRNGLVLLNYVMENMPNDAPATLSNEQYAAVVAMLLASNGFPLPDVPLTPENAASVVLGR